MSSRNPVFDMDMNTARVCGKCNVTGLVSRMVGCDMCDIWLHHACAGIESTDLDPNNSWRCEKCLYDEATEVASQGSNKSIKSTSSRARRAELELKQLAEKTALIQKQREEEDQLRKKRAEEDEQLLSQKFDLLQAIQEEEEEEARSNIDLGDQPSSKGKCESWLASGMGSEEQQLVPATCTSSSQTPLAAPGLQRVPPSKVASTNQSVPYSTSTPNTTVGQLSVLPQISAPGTGIPPLSIPASSFWNRGVFPMSTLQSSTATTLNQGFGTYPSAACTAYLESQNPSSFWNRAALAYLGCQVSSAQGVHVGQTSLVPPSSASAGFSFATSNASGTVPTTALSGYAVPTASVAKTHPPVSQQQPLPPPVIPTSSCTAPGVPPGLQFGPPVVPSTTLGTQQVPVVPMTRPGPQTVPVSQPVSQALPIYPPPIGPQIQPVPIPPLVTQPPLAPLPQQFPPPQSVPQIQPTPPPPSIPLPLPVPLPQQVPLPSSYPAPGPQSLPPVGQPSYPGGAIGNPGVPQPGVPMRAGPTAL